MTSILVVDDDDAILHVLKLILQKHGYSVGVAKTGQEAIEESTKIFYDLAIIDFHLPDISGINLVRVLSTRSSKTKKIILTGELQSVNEEAAAGDQFDFLTKPLSAEDLLKAIKKKLSQ